MQDFNYVIRPIRENDVPQVAEIDREVFPSEWMFRFLSSYQKEFKKNPMAHYLVACVGDSSLPKPGQSNTPLRAFSMRDLFHRSRQPRGAEEGRRTPYIVGFAGLWLMAHNAHIMSIAVRSKHRGAGIGEALLISIIDQATILNANIVTLEVRASNEIAQELYRKYGFEIVGSRSRYYSDNGEDAIIMSTDSIVSDSFQSHFLKLKKEHAQRYNCISLRIP